jgi:hypothetical protein
MNKLGIKESQKYLRNQSSKQKEQKTFYFMVFFILEVAVCLHPLFFFGSTGIWMQGLVIAKQVLYYSSHDSSLCLRP